MQLIPSYLYSNRVDVYTNLGSWTIERYQKVYQRNLKLYRGVDNRLDFQIRNGQEKAQPIPNLSVVFNLVGVESKELVVQKDCTIVDADLGRVFVMLAESDMEGILAGHYNYSLFTQNSAGVKTVVYGDSQYGATGTVDVFGYAFGEPLPSAESPLRDGVDPRVTDEFDAKPSFNSNAGLHTFAFYTTDYIGTIELQATMEEESGDNWVTLETVNLDNQPISYKNVTGVWSRLRVKETSVTEGTLDNVLYRY